MSGRLIFVVVLAVSLNSVPTVFAEPNLIAHWEFDEVSGGTAYDSAGSNDGTLVGSPNWTSGKIGGALDVNGYGDYVSVPDDDSLDITGAITISSWLKLDEEVNSIHRIAGKIANSGSYTGGGYRLLFDNREIYTDGTCRLVFQKSSGVGGTGSGNYGTNTNWDRVVSETNTWETGVWYHFVATWDGTTDTNSLKLYINGVLNAVHTASQGTIKTNSYALLISGSLDGLLDDVRIYDGALTAEEIEELYLEGDAYMRAVINIEGALAEKMEVMDKIDAAMAKEQAAHEALEEMWKSGDYDDLDKHDILRAMQQVHQALQSERQLLHFLDKSVESLEGSLADLNWDPNLVAHWKFDEGEGDIAYDSAGDNDGDIYGAMWTSGQIGGALDFDGGGDYVDCGNGGSLDITDAITVGAWIKRPNFETHGVIAGKTNGNSVTAGYGLFSYKEGMEFNFYSGNWRRTTPRVPTSAGEWHYVAGTYDGSIAYLYIDGEQRASRVYAGTIAAATGHPFNIGFWRSGLPTYFNGEIDDIRVYNRALSAEEIQQLYEDGE